MYEDTPTTQRRLMRVGAHPRRKTGLVSTRSFEKWPVSERKPQPKSVPDPVVRSGKGSNSISAASIVAARASAIEIDFWEGRC